MFIKNTKFISSYTKVGECPKTKLPEFAFIGRSNVGKSSLINMLLLKKKLAKISNTPGKTQLINFFLVNVQWHLVDLPGYGYAKISKSMRGKWEGMIKNYLMKRQNLIYTFVLIDSRLPPQKIDIDFINWMGSGGIPFVIAFTKADKQKPKMTEENIKLFNAKLKETWDELPIQFTTSCVTREGREGILKFIENTIAEYSDTIVSDIK